MRADLRLTVRQNYGFRCGYCSVHENEVGAGLTLDHFQPRSRGGDDNITNLVYCCHACNEFKSDFWQPDRTAEERLLHPLRDDLNAHYREADDATLQPLTNTGAFHIAYLHLNRPELVALRRDRLRVEAAQRERQVLMLHMACLEQQVKTLETEVDTLTSTGSDDV